MKRKTVLSIGLAIACTLLLGVGNAMAAANVNVHFVEDGVTGNGIHGVQGTWAYPLSQLDIPCPANNGDINFIGTFVKGTNSGNFLTLGFENKKTGGFCTTGNQNFYFIEGDTPVGGFFHTDFSLPTSASHTFRIVRFGSPPCSANFCWHFQVDGGSTLDIDCCQGDLTHFLEVRSGMLCHRDNATATANCNSTGEATPSGLQFRDPSAGWTPWKGHDAACVDFNQKARGKWTGPDSDDMGYNVTINNSLTNAC